MGVPMVGKRHHGKTSTSQGAVGKFGAISERISSTRRGGRSSLNNQQSLNTQDPPKNNPEHALGTLSSGGTASQSDIHARRLSDLCQQLDSASMGDSSLRRDQNYRSGTLATSDGGNGRDQSQAKVRHVGRVLTRRALGVLRPQSNFLRHTGWNGGKEGSEHWCTGQREAPESSPRVITRRGQAGAGAIGVSRPASCVCRRCLRNTSRRAWGTALVRLRLQQHELQCSTFVLLATRRTPEEHENRSISEVVAYARESEARFAGMEITKSLQPADRLRLPVRKAQGQQATRLGFGVEEEDPTGVQEDVSRVWAGTHSGTRWEPCLRRWANTNS